MYKIICDRCDEDIIFEEIFRKPEVCSNCNYSIANLEPQKITEMLDTIINDTTERLTGLTLIYQKTGEKITLGQDNAIIGRASYGSNVLEKVQYISGSHCLIELIDNQYMITDLGSFNGTFLGISRINCKDNPRQILKHNDLVFLGKEVFLVQLHFEYQISEKITSVLGNSTGQEDETSNKKDPIYNGNSVVYRCKTCGKVYQHKKDICKNKCQECNTFDYWEEILT